MAASVDEEGGGRDILAVCRPQDKLIKGPHIERASAGPATPTYRSLYPQRPEKAGLSHPRDRIPARWPLADPEGVVPTRSQTTDLLRKATFLEQSTRGTGNRVDRVQHPFAHPWSFWSDASKRPPISTGRFQGLLTEPSSVNC